MTASTIILVALLAFALFDLAMLVIWGIALISQHISGPVSVTGGHAPVSINSDAEIRKRAAAVAVAYALAQQESTSPDE